MARNTPWIVLLCKFSDDPGTATVRSIAEYAAFFGGDGRDSIPSYWNDISYGELNLVAGTEISPWLVLPHKRAEHTGLGTRGQLVAWAKAAGVAAGIDLSRFFGTAIMFGQQTDLFGGTGGGPHVVCDPFSTPSQTLQEFGHAYGVATHSSSVAKSGPHENPFCVMSSDLFGGDIDIFRGVNPTFSSRWGQMGPGLCSPYLNQLGWLTESRKVNISSNGRYPKTTVIELSALGERNPRRAQAAVIEFELPDKVRYFIEYRRGGWDRGITYDPVVVHQVRADGVPYYAGLIRPFLGAPNAPRGPAISTGKWHADPGFDLSIEVLGAAADRSTITLRIAPRAAARVLSVRGIARARLNLAQGFSLRGQVMAGQGAVRGRLIELLGQP